MDFRLRKVIGGFLFTFILWFVFLSLVISRSLESKWQMINPAFFCTCLFGMFFEDFLMFKKKQHFTEREFEEEVFCVICQELTTEGVVLKCNHSFHEKCLSDWTTRSSKCPLCMTKIEEKKEEEEVIVWLINCCVWKKSFLECELIFLFLRFFIFCYGIHNTWNFYWYSNIMFVTLWKTQGFLLCVSSQCLW